MYILCQDSTNECTYVHTYIRMYVVCMHTHTPICMHTRPHMYTPTHPHIHMHPHAHPHSHPHPHTPHMHTSVRHAVVAYLSHVEVLVLVWEVRELSRRAVDVHKCWAKCWQKACTVHHNTHSFITKFPFQVNEHMNTIALHILSHGPVFTCHMTTPGHTCVT